MSEITQIDVELINLGVVELNSEAPDVGYEQVPIVCSGVRRE